MVKKYKEPSIAEGQMILSAWQKVTSSPMTSREVEFAREIISRYVDSKEYERVCKELIIERFKKEKVLFALKWMLDHPGDDSQEAVIQIGEYKNLVKELDVELSALQKLRISVLKTMLKEGEQK